MDRDCIRGDDLHLYINCGFTVHIDSDILVDLGREFLGVLDIIREASNMVVDFSYKREESGWRVWFMKTLEMFEGLKIKTFDMRRVFMGYTHIERKDLFTVLKRLNPDNVLFEDKVGSVGPPFLLTPDDKKYLMELNIKVLSTWYIAGMNIGGMTNGRPGNQQWAELCKLKTLEAIKFRPNDVVSAHELVKLNAYVASVGKFKYYGKMSELIEVLLEKGCMWQVSNTCFSGGRYYDNILCFKNHLKFGIKCIQ